MFEGWKDVPLAVHRQLADWDVDYYAEKIRPGVQSARAGRPDDSYEARYSYVLLDEAEAIVAAQDHIYLWPCDCRSIVSNCRKPMYVCIRFGNDRGLGWEISKERAVEVLRQTDKAGLMHTADVRERPGDTTSICNCCTDCCYPHLAAERLETGDVWPIRRHVARIDMDLCKDCGRCGLRCPFAAIVCGTAAVPSSTRRCAAAAASARPAAARTRSRWCRSRPPAEPAVSATHRGLVRRLSDPLIGPERPRRNSPWGGGRPQLQRSSSSSGRSPRPTGPSCRSWSPSSSRSTSAAAWWSTRRAPDGGGGTGRGRARGGSWSSSPPTCTRSWSPCCGRSSAGGRPQASTSPCSRRWRWSWRHRPASSTRRLRPRVGGHRARRHGAPRPPGLVWLPPLYFVKLVMAHAVPDE